MVSQIEVLKKKIPLVPITFSYQGTLMVSEMNVKVNILSLPSLLHLSSSFFFSLRLYSIFIFLSVPFIFRQSPPTLYLTQGAAAAIHPDAAAAVAAAAAVESRRADWTTRGTRLGTAAGNRGTAAARPAPAAAVPAAAATARDSGEAEAGRRSSRGW